MDLKENYALNHRKKLEQSLNLNKRLFNTYNRITKKKFFRSKHELKNKIFRRSIYAVKDIKKNEKFSRNNIRSFRPDVGLSASFYLKILGQKSPIFIKKNNVLKKSLQKKIF